MTTDSVVFEQRPGRRLEYAVKRVSGVPAVALRLWFAGGSRVESEPGLASLTGRMLSEGTVGCTWSELARRFENRGMSASSFGSLEAHGITIDALAADWRRALQWLRELAFESAFPAERCEWLLEQTRAELASQRDQPETLAAWAFSDQLYRPHPASRPVIGTEAGLDAIAAHDSESGAELCRVFHQEALAQRAVLTVTGLVDPQDVAQAIEETFGDLDGASARPIVVAPPRGSDEMRVRVETGVEDQSHLFMGHLTLPIDHQDLAALQIAGVVLGSGSGLTGRIPERVREREGLAYTAQAGTLSGAGIDPGRFTVYVGTAPETAARAEAVVREEVRRFVEDGPNLDEFASAKAYLLGRDPFRRETARQWGDLLADALFYRLPIHEPEWRRARLERVSHEQVLAAVRKHLDEAEMRVTLGARGALSHRAGLTPES